MIRVIVLTPPGARRVAPRVVVLSLGVLVGVSMMS